MEYLQKLVYCTFQTCIRRGIFATDMSKTYANFRPTVRFRPLLITKRNIQSPDFTVNRVLMKLFKTSNIDITRMWANAQRDGPAALPTTGGALCSPPQFG